MGKRASWSGYMSLMEVGGMRWFPLDVLCLEVEGVTREVSSSERWGRL